MKKLFPQTNKVYIQNNRSNIYPEGNLWSTFGIDLQSNLGVMRVSPRLRINSQTSDLANLGCPVAFKYYSGAYRTVAGPRVFTGGATPNAVFTQDAASGSPTTCSSDTADMEVFDGRLWVTSQTELLSNGTSGAYDDWTTRDTLVSGFPHITRYFPQFNRLYTTNGTSVRSIDSSNVVASSGDYFLSLPFGNLISSMDMSPTSIWIGTESKDVANMNGNIFQWDGISAQATNVYPMNAKAVLAIKINPKTNTPYVMDSNGVLSAFNGSGFEEVGRLPYTTQLPYNNDGLVSNKFIHPNGLAYTKNDTFLALINNLNDDNAGTINENLPSGPWEWSKETNFVHKYLFTYNTVANSTITDFGQNRISRPGAIAMVATPNTTSGQYGTIMAGATIYTDASTTTNAIFIDDSLDTVQKKGYFVIDWSESDEIADKWNRFWISYRRFLDANDKIVVKYRNYEEAPVEASITWVNTTSFTTTTDITAYGPTASGFNSTTGGEVEVTRGTGGASCAHITSVTGPSGGLYTVTLDETITGVTTGTATARFQKWLKLNDSVMGQVKSWADFGINASNPDASRIQVKSCFTFTGQGEFYKAAIVSISDIKINP